jgi:hypothetical protein
MRKHSKQIRERGTRRALEHSGGTRGGAWPPSTAHGGQKTRGRRESGTMGRGSPRIHRSAAACGRLRETTGAPPPLRRLEAEEGRADGRGRAVKCDGRIQPARPKIPPRAGREEARLVCEGHTWGRPASATGGRSAQRIVEVGDAFRGCERTPVERLACRLRLGPHFELGGQWRLTRIEATSIQPANHVAVG